MIKINTKLILKNVHKVIILVLNVWNDKAVMKKIAHTANDLVTPIYIYTYNNTECISQMEVYTISLINFIFKIDEFKKKNCYGNKFVFK